MSAYQGGPFAPAGYRSALDDSTLARFFNAVYAWMAVGLAVTALSSFATYTFAQQVPGLFTLTTGIILFVVQMVLVFTIANAIQRVPTPVASGLFLLYSALMGVSLSTLFFAYSKSTLATTFLETSLAFAVTSVYGMVTKRDLSRFGNLLFMGLIGIVLASVINIFLHSTMLMWIVSYAGVALFIGLTAYDTQRLKVIAEQTRGNATMSGRMAIVGSLMLYLDFINLFLFILQAFNSRRD